MNSTTAEGENLAGQADEQDTFKAQQEMPPDVAFEFLHNHDDIGTKPFWGKDTTVVLLLRIRQDKKLWNAILHKAEVAGVFVPRLIAYLDRWVEFHPEWHPDPPLQAEDPSLWKPEAPLPLRRALSPPDQYPIDALGKVLAPMARCLMEVVQAPDAICGQAVLAAASLAVQGHGNVVIDGRSSPLSEFFLCVAESGERKTTADNYAVWAHRQRERRLAEEYPRQFHSYQNAMDAYRKAREEALRQAKSMNAKQVALEALGPPPLAPLEPVFLTQEPTYEGLIKLLLVGFPSLGLFSAEGGRFVGGYGMSPDQQLKTAAGLSELWDGTPITRVRAGDSTAVLYGRRLSMHLMVQPKVARLVLGNALLLDQGLLSRCLVAWPETTAGSRSYKAINLTTNEDVEHYNDAMKHILETPLPLADGSVHELNPRSLALNAKAKKLWIAFHNHVEQQLGSNGSLAPVRGFASKAAEHAVRLAGIRTLTDNLQATEINAEHIEAGIAIAEFYLTEAVRLFQSSDTEPDLELAEKLLSWAQEQQEHVVHMRQVYQYGPNSIRDTKTAKRIVNILEEHGWFRRVPEGQEIEGVHRRDVWEVQT